MSKGQSFNKICRHNYFVIAPSSSGRYASSHKRISPSGGGDASSNLAGAIITINSVYPSLPFDNLDFYN